MVNSQWSMVNIIGFATLLSLFLVSPLHAQSNCTLKLADLSFGPELVGFHMGMTKDEVKKRVPQVEFGKTNDFGVSKTTINPDFDPSIDKASFKGVRSVSLDFLDGRMTSLWLGYDATFKWKTVEDFVAGITPSLKLPNAWQQWKVRGRQLKCADFTMTVSTIAEGPSFRIVDQSAEDLIASRRAEKEEQDSAEPDADTRPEIVADSQTKTYYSADCSATKTIPAKDRITFKSTEEAEKAGYKRAVCAQ